MQHIGVDIVEIARIEKAVGHWGQGFLKRVYTGKELKLYGARAPSLAARFSGKEAVIKALNGHSIALKDIEILSDISGKPRIKLYRQAQQQADAMGLVSLTISLSHCKDYAIACAIGETRN
jgi:holo-[acyl-carrier protein] synthase